jgi:tryptophan synthase alpha chain
MAVTGKSEGGGEGERVVRSIRRTSDVPALIGIGIATPDQAKQAAGVSDGVIVGSALVQIVMDHASASDVESFIREFRSAIDNEA